MTFSLNANCAVTSYRNHRSCLCHPPDLEQTNLPPGFFSSFSGNSTARWRILDTHRLHVRVVLFQLRPSLCLKLEDTSFATLVSEERVFQYWIRCDSECHSKLCHSKSTHISYTHILLGVLYHWLHRRCGRCWLVTPKCLSNGLFSFADYHRSATGLHTAYTRPTNYCEEYPYGTTPSQASALGALLANNSSLPAALLTGGGFVDIHDLKKKPNGSIRVELENRSLWKGFNDYGTEMIITKAGR